MPDLAARIVSQHTIGGSDTDNSHRCVAWGYFKDGGGGWARFIDEQIRPQLNNPKWPGLHRFMIDSPGGNLTGRNKELDQFVHARDGIVGIHPPLPMLINDFVSAFTALRKEQAAKGRPLEVICYLGTESGDPDFDPTKTTYAQRRARRLDSVHLPLSAGMSIAFDYVTDFAKESEAAREVQNVAASHRVYVEGWPTLANPWPSQFNVAASGGNIDKGHTDGWGVPSVKGEVVALFDEQDRTKLVSFARRHLAAGRSVGLWVSALMEMGVGIADLN